MADFDETQLLGFLEAVYSLEVDDQSWLLQTLRSLAALCGGQHHYLAFFYDASNVADFKLWNVCAPTIPPEVESSFAVFQTVTGPAFVRNTLRSLHVGSASRTGMPYMAPVLAERERCGWGDIFNINGLDPSGIGCLLTIGCRAPVFVPSPRELTLYRRMATHLAAAFRCRRRLGVSQADAPVDRKPGSGTEGAEAILDAQGRLLHAVGPASGKTARERIRSSAASIDALRTRSKQKGVRDVLDVWHPLTSARWTLVDCFEENGHRYVVARENQAQTQGFTALTDRERQVVLHAALGFTNKQIAYTLGISDTTVRVLMARAAGRLGVHTRRELLAHPSLEDIRPVALDGG
jgi:DNA-binding CsgD family transcriptional regulator